MTDPAPGESRRLAALRALQLLDTPAEPFFDRVARVAASVCDTPMAAITLIDEDRQWFKAKIGLDIDETARAIAFCNYTIRGARPFVVSDAGRDDRFMHNPLVVGPPGIRFYTGVPLLTTDGEAVGAIAVMDVRPRRLGRGRLDVLRMLADQVMAHAELQCRQRELQSLLETRDTLNAQLAQQAQALREAHYLARLGGWTMDLPSRALHLSEETFRIFGVPRADGTVAFEAFLSSVHRDDRDALLSAIAQTIARGRPLDVAHRIVQRGGVIRHVRQRGELRLAADGSAALAGTVQDVSEEHAARERQELLAASIERVEDIVMITEAAPLDEPGPRIVFVNGSFERRTGYAIEEAIGRSPRFLQGPETRRIDLDRIRRALEQDRGITVELVNYRKDGTPFWSELDIAPFAIAGERTTHFVSVQRDVTARRESARQIERLAFFDVLTGLPNRRLLLDRLGHVLQAAGRASRGAAVLFIDLDGFKGLNDTLGHDKGDRLLQLVAQRLQAGLRKGTTVARFGGDEFVILLEDLEREPHQATMQAEAVAEKVLDSFRQPFELGDHRHHCTPSIGVTLVDGGAQGLEEVLKRADLAMYEAKAAGRNTIRFFDPRMQDLVDRRMALDRDLRASLQEEHFVLHYQPQVNSVGDVVGSEALVRWQHPRRGLVYPNEFITLAEESGLIIHLGQWILETACRQLADWARHGDGGAPRVAVNVSARQFHHPEFLPRTLSVLRSTGVDPADVTLELTESTFLDHTDDAICTMRRLKDHGIGFSLDDFGTGYSSLAYLKRLPLDELKIDRAFVRDVLIDSNDAAIARTIVSLGKTLGLAVVAEGVETEGQRDFLVREGCHVYQGYLIGPPGPAAALM